MSSTGHTHGRRTAAEHAIDAASLSRIYPHSVRKGSENGEPGGHSVVTSVAHLLSIVGWAV